MTCVHRMSIRYGTLSDINSVLVSNQHTYCILWNSKAMDTGTGRACKHHRMGHRRERRNSSALGVKQGGPPGTDYEFDQGLWHCLSRLSMVCYWQQAQAKKLQAKTNLSAIVHLPRGADERHRTEEPRTGRVRCVWVRWFHSLNEYVSPKFAAITQAMTLWHVCAVLKRRQAPQRTAG